MSIASISASPSKASTSATISGIISSTFIPPQPSAMNASLLPRHSSPTALSLGGAALGWATTVAISLLMLQWMNNKEKKKTSPWDWIYRTISQLIGTDSRSSQNNTTENNSKSVSIPPKDEENEDERVATVLLHRGSCHCGSITFQLTPARHVRVIKSPQCGKLQYPTARVPSDQLQLRSGKHLWNTYHVQADDGATWAYSFCKLCAIHILHATDADQSSLFVNLQCFNMETKQSEETATVPTPVPTPVNGDDDSVTGRGSVVSTFTAATQKSMMTSVTSLPEYAHPKALTGQQRSSSNFSNDSSLGSDSATPVDPPRPIRRNRLPPSMKAAPKSFSKGRQFKSSLGSKDPSWALPRGVIEYSPTSGAPGFSSPMDPHSQLTQQMAPKEWHARDEDIGEEDDDISISSHSAATRDGIDYPSTSTMEGNTAASTTANSTGSSSVDYNVSINRERMLQNMRKHLKASPAKQPKAHESLSEKQDETF